MRPWCPHGLTDTTNLFHREKLVLPHGSRMGHQDLVWWPLCTAPCGSVPAAHFAWPWELLPAPELPGRRDRGG